MINKVNISQMPLIFDRRLDSCTAESSDKGQVDINTLSKRFEVSRSKVSSHLVNTERSKLCNGYVKLTDWGRDRMATISQATLSNEFL